MVDMVSQSGGAVSVREDMVQRMLDAGFRFAPPKAQPKPARRRAVRRTTKK